MSQEVISVKNVFTEDELLEIGKLLSTVLQDKEDMEKEKKEVDKDFTERIKLKSVAISQLRDQIHNGFEMVDALCDIELDFTKKVRRYINIHTSNVEKEEVLHKEDYQLQIVDEVHPITSVKDSEIF